MYSLSQFLLFLPLFACVSLFLGVVHYLYAQLSNTPQPLSTSDPLTTPTSHPIHPVKHSNTPPDNRNKRARMAFPGRRGHAGSRAPEGMPARPANGDGKEIAVTRASRACPDWTPPAPSAPMGCRCPAADGGRQRLACVIRYRLRAIENPHSLTPILHRKKLINREYICHSLEF